MAYPLLVLFVGIMSSSGLCVSCKEPLILPDANFVQNVDHLSHAHSRIVCVYIVNFNFLPMLCFVLIVALFSHAHNSKVFGELQHAL